ncbi:unnamed protein product [Chrysoparadoxa australica]
MMSCKAFLFSCLVVAPLCCALLSSTPIPGLQSRSASCLRCSQRTNSPFNAAKDQVGQQTLYQLLGLDQGDSATQREIREAYARLSKTFLGFEDSQLFFKIREAYNVLSNTEMKRRYDGTLEVPSPLPDLVEETRSQAAATPAVTAAATELGAGGLQEADKHKRRVAGRGGKGNTIVPPRPARTLQDSYNAWLPVSSSHSSPASAPAPAPVSVAAPPVPVAAPAPAPTPISRSSWLPMTFSEPQPAAPSTAAPAHDGSVQADSVQSSPSAGYSSTAMGSVGGDAELPGSLTGVQPAVEVRMEPVEARPVETRPVETRIEPVVEAVVEAVREAVVEPLREAVTEPSQPTSNEVNWAEMKRPTPLSPQVEPEPMPVGYVNWEEMKRKSGVYEQVQRELAVKLQKGRKAQKAVALEATAEPAEEAVAAVMPVGERMIVTEEQPEAFGSIDSSGSYGSLHVADAAAEDILKQPVYAEPARRSEQKWSSREVTPEEFRYIDNQVKKQLGAVVSPVVPGVTQEESTYAEGRTVPGSESPDQYSSADTVADTSNHLQQPSSIQEKAAKETSRPLHLRRLFSGRDGQTNPVTPDEQEQHEVESSLSQEHCRVLLPLPLSLIRTCVCSLSATCTQPQEVVPNGNHPEHPVGQEDDERWYDLSSNTWRSFQSDVDDTELPGSSVNDYDWYA